MDDFSSASASASTSALPSPGIQDLNELDFLGLQSQLQRRAASGTPETDVEGEDDAGDFDNLELSPIVLGGGVFGAQYNPQEYLESETPAQVIELALENGINAIDTSPFYGNSESIIGNALSSPRIASRFPRSSYRLITKCGRYGANKRSFDYSPQRIRQSVQTSLERLKTNYLDVVYLHDVEFVAEELGDANAAGYPLNALQKEHIASYGLEAGSEAVIHGKGDEAILAAFETLLDLKREGLIRKAGMAGYPLPTMLRLARLIRHHLGPVDIVQSYSHYNLQNTTLSTYAPLLRQAGVGRVTNASLLNMGLLCSQGPPEWHLAPPSLRRACKEANDVLAQQRATTIQHTALGFGLGSTADLQCNAVVGCTRPEHVHQLLSRWNELYAPLKDGGSTEEKTNRSKAIDLQRQNEELVHSILEPSNLIDWSWQSPPPFEEAERNQL